MWLIVLQLFAGMATNGVFPVIYSFVSDAAEHGAIGTANSVMLTAMYIGGFHRWFSGVLIGVGGGFSSATGYDWGLYFLVAACVLAVVLLALFTREPAADSAADDRAPGLTAEDAAAICSSPPKHRSRPLTQAAIVHTTPQSSTTKKSKE